MIKSESLPRYRYKTSGGYVKLHLPGHPLADSNGCVLEHRKVAYDLFPVHTSLSCFWCRKEVRWDTLVIDHLNNNREDNEPSNLLISCNGCNRLRGSAKAFVERLTDDGYKLFMTSVNRTS